MQKEDNCTSLTEKLATEQKDKQVGLEHLEGERKGRADKYDTGVDKLQQENTA